MTMKAYYNEGKNGEILTEKEIPAEYADQAEELRAALIEKVAEFDDSLMEKFFEGDISVEAMPKSLLQPIIRKATIDMKITPAFCGTSLGNKGTQLLLDAIVDYLPAPTDVPNVTGTEPGKKDVEITRKSSDAEKFSGLAFKIATDPFIGKLAFFRVYSGVLTKGSYVYNSTKDKRERVGRLVRMHANSRTEIDEAYAGDIVAIVGLKDTTTGDTLCDENAPIILESMEFPDPVIQIAIEPKTKADRKSVV